MKKSRLTLVGVLGLTLITSIGAIIACCIKNDKVTTFFAVGLFLLLAVRFLMELIVQKECSAYNFFNIANMFLVGAIIGSLNICGIICYISIAAICIVLLCLSFFMYTGHEE